VSNGAGQKTFFKPIRKLWDVFGVFFRHKPRNGFGLYEYAIPKPFRGFCLEKSSRKPSVFLPRALGFSLAPRGKYRRESSKTPFVFTIYPNFLSNGLSRSGLDNLAISVACDEECLERGAEMVFGFRQDFFVRTGEMAPKMYWPRHFNREHPRKVLT